MAKSKTAWKSFEKWLEQEVLTEFGLQRHFDLQFLKDLFSNLSPLTNEDKVILNKLHHNAVLYSDAWREEDLKMMFIAGMMSIPGFEHPQRIYRPYYDYPLKAILKKQPINGIVDCLIAKGFQIADKPIFFLQEYKPQTRPSGDPLGQLLIAMLASQHLNNDFSNPLYGCYIIGSMWFFIVLQGADFSVSQSYSATQIEDLEIITAVLIKIKHLYDVKLNLVA